MNVIYILKNSKVSLELNFLIPFLFIRNMKRVCIICGKELKNKEDVICETCKIKSVVRKSKKESIIVCKCLRYKKGNTWMDPPLRYYSSYPEYLRSILNRHFPSHNIMEISEKEAILKNEDEIKVIEFLGGTCDVCSRIHGGYYEGKIQLRGTKSFIEEAENKIIQMIERIKHPLAFISKINYLKEGTDIYIGTKTLINKIKKAFTHHETKVSKELYGVKDGKKVYRVTLLIREKGDTHGKKRKTK